MLKIIEVNIQIYCEQTKDFKTELPWIQNIRALETYSRHNVINLINPVFFSPYHNIFTVVEILW